MSEPANIESGMRIRRAGAANAGFAMMEVLVAVGLLGLTFGALYSGISSGFATVMIARENLRATQILQEKMETIRLYTWDQINKTNFIPGTFVEPYYTSDDSNGLMYTGTVTVATAPFTATYSSKVRMVSVELKWKSGGVLRTREISTFVAQDGLQEYIY